MYEFKTHEFTSSGRPPSWSGTDTFIPNRAHLCTAATWLLFMYSVQFPAIKAFLCIEINQCCHSCRRLFLQWWPLSGCTLCSVHCMYTLILHAGFNRRTSLSPSPISPVWGFVIITSQCTAHWLQFFKHFLLRFCFEIYKQFNFVGEGPELSQYSIFNFCCAKIFSPYTAFSFHCTDSAVQAHRPWAIPDPAFSYFLRWF
jgi:hypothetical protein